MQLPDLTEVTEMRRVCVAKEQICSDLTEVGRGGCVAELSQIKPPLDGLSFSVAPGGARSGVRLN